MFLLRRMELLSRRRATTGSTVPSESRGFLPFCVYYLAPLLLLFSVVNGYNNADSADLEHSSTTTSMDDTMMSDDDDGTMPNNDNNFCKGMPMAMFMDGFHRSLLPHHNNNTNDNHRQAQPACLIYFVSGWILDDEDKFKGAMMFSFLLGLCMEILSASRGAASHYVRRPAWARVLCLTTIYAVQGLLGYLLMFLAMTFSLEIILATVLGLCVGNLAFFRYEDFQPHRKRRNNGNDTTTTTTISQSAETTDNDGDNDDSRGLRQPLLADNGSRNN